MLLRRLDSRRLGAPRRRRAVQRYPVALERQYDADLRRYVGRIAAIVTAEVAAAAPALLAGARRADDVSGVQPGTGWPEELRRMLERILARSASLDPDLLARIHRMRENVNAHHAREWRRVLRAAYGVNVLAREPGLRALLDAWEMNNTALIKSVPQQLVTQIQTTFTQALARGTTARELTKLVRERLGIAQGQARRIARDQVSKLNGRLSRERQQGIGVSEYVWRTAMDERVRASHRAVNGQRFAWGTPPASIGEEPGQPILCRCYPEAVLPLLADLPPDTTIEP